MRREFSQRSTETPCGGKANTLGRTSGVQRARPVSPCSLSPIARMDDGFFATHVQSGGRQQRSAFCKVSFSFAHKDILCVCKAYTKVVNVLFSRSNRKYICYEESVAFRGKTIKYHNHNLKTVMRSVLYVT